MVYQRTIKKDGKIVGTYLYKSIRQKDGSVKSVYVGNAYENKDTLHPLLFLFIVAAVMLILFLSFKTILTGYFAYAPQETYSKEISFAANESVIYEFEIEHDFFELNSLSISGSMSGEKAEVYLDIENKSYLIGEFSNSPLGMVGYAISEIEEGAEEQQQPSEIVVEQPAEENLTNISQENEAIGPVAVINETQGEIIENETAEIVIINDTHEEMIVNESQDIEDIVHDISFPEEKNETNIEAPENKPIFEEIKEVKNAEFKDSCYESCAINEIGIGKTKLKLRIILTNSNIKIDYLAYSITNLKDALNIDSETLNELKENGKAKIIVDLKEKHPGKIMAAGEKNVDEIKVKKKFSSSNSVAGEISKDDLKELIHDKQIEQIQLDSINQIQLADSVNIINASGLWQTQINGINITGTGETACVVDTGVAQHNALSGKIIGSHCYCSVSGPCCPNGQTEDTNAADDNSHGTHVSGIIASSDATYKGVAPDSKIVAVKVCNSAGYCASSDMISGVEFCVNNASAYNISVISMSIGGGSYTSYCDSTLAAMTSAINAARAKGIIVSIASGNNGYNDRIMWPACVENATAVMATDKSDNIASYSNRNALVDLAATGGSSGNAIISTVLNNGFAGKYGTSMATPHVSGAVILLRQYIRLYSNTTLSPLEIEQILKRTGKQINDSSMIFYRINVLNAINSIPKINKNENSIEKPGKARIKFSESTDLSEWNAFTIESNLISLNPNLYPQYNKTAEVTFYSLGFEKIPVILKNGEYCADCTVLNYSNGTLLFSINGFSSYSSSENSLLEISDNANGAALVNQEIIFYANYSSKASGSIINGSCAINFNDSISQMILNESYSYSRMFSDWAEYHYNITCNSSDFETLSDSGIINITKSIPIIILTLNNKSDDISILKNNSVEIKAELINPSNGTLKLYLNDSLINEGSIISNITEFNELGNFTVNSTYAGNENYSSANIMLKINVINDTAPPYWSSIKGASNAYGKDRIYQINATWTDNVDVEASLIENNFFGNFSNYSLSAEGNEYSYSFGNISAGSYSFRIYANDSSGNMNFTDMLNLAVNKSSNPMSLYINNVQGNSTIAYGAQSTVNAAAEGEVYLYKDSIQISNPIAEILAVKTSGYAFKANATANQNYTANSTGQTFYLFVNKAEPAISIYLNDNYGDITTNPGTVRIRAVMAAPLNSTFELYQDSSKIAEGISPLAVNRTLLFTGTYKINATFAGNSNYTGKSRISYITIQQTTQQNQSQQTQPLQQQPPEEEEQQNQIASSQCTPSWKCSEWSSCMMGKKVRMCSDSNSCGTVSGKPMEMIDCSCKESWKCEEWTQCIDGKQTRTCTDLGKCAADKTEIQFCFLAAPLQTKGAGYIITSLEYAGKTINYIKTNVIPVLKEYGFSVGFAIAIAAILFMFRNNLINIPKKIKGYKFDIKFKVSKKRK